MIPIYELPKSDLNVIHNERELRFHEHLHEQIEIVYVFSGGQHMKIGDTDYEIKEGNAAIIFPDTVHNYYRNEIRSADEVLLIISPKLISNVFGSFKGLTPKEPIISDIDSTTKDAFMHLHRCTSSSEKLGWAVIILSRLIEKVELTKTSGVPIDNLPQKIIEYIAVNFQHELTLDSIAKEFSISKYYVSHVFSDKLKISFRNYLSLVRTEHAASLIRNGDDSITNICSESGFASQRTFNRIFKQVYGVSPTEYKNNVGKFLK